MKTKDEILHTLKCMDINHDIDSTVKHQRAEILIEVLIDIRDAIITDCKDAMNALIEIRKNH